jgi:hypothetical protein
LKIPFKTYTYPSFGGESKRGFASLIYFSPSPSKERGIKGVR